MSVAVAEKAMTKSMMQVLIVMSNLQMPTFQGIADQLGHASTNGVRKHIAKLIDLGYVWKMDTAFGGRGITTKGRELLNRHKVR